MLSEVGSVSSMSHGSGSVVEKVVVLIVGPLQSYPIRADVAVMEASSMKAVCMLSFSLLLTE